jgi:hypothetical protein
MSTAYQEDISSNVLRRMKEGGFDFSRFHPIEFYAIFPDEERARGQQANFAVNPSMPRSVRATTAPGRWN